MGKVTRQCPLTTIFEEKGKAKADRTEVLLLTSLAPNHWAKPTLTTDARYLLLLYRSPDRFYNPTPPVDQTIITEHELFH